MSKVDTDTLSVLDESVGPIRILTLNRPEKLNAADLEMQERLLESIQAVANDSGARALILTGAGRAFSAGGDRDILRKIAEGQNDGHEALARVHVGTIRAMLGLTIPAIAAVPGPAVGYAAGLVAMCDFVVMGENAFLCDPHVTFGIAATTAAQLIWPRRTSEGLAREILMSGRKVGAQEAVAIGLANRLCPAGEELATALELAQTYAALPAGGVGGTKRAFNRPLLRMFEEELAASD
jgi:enoyl-CoA hydratase